MRLGIIGLPGSGKTTVFNALTGSTASIGDFSGAERGRTWHRSRSLNRVSPYSPSSIAPRRSLRLRWST